MAQPYLDGIPTNRLPYNSRQRKPSSESDVLLGLNELRKEGHFCDVTLAVEGAKFPAHKNVLASFSPYFKAMFTSKLAESRQDVVAVSGVEPAMMELLLGYAYTGSAAITRGNVQSLLSAANLLQVLPVEEAACLYLERHMDTTNCVGIHCFAEAHGCSGLATKACMYSLRNFWDIAHGEEFVSLSAPKLVEFISSDDLMAEKEETVFQAVIRWYSHDPDSRKQDFHKVLEHVRLPLLSPYFLHDCVESQAVVRDSPECQQLVEEAKMYHLLPDRRMELQSSRTKPRRNAETIQVIVAVGGEDDKVVLRSVECYDTVSRTWRALACLPFAVSKHGLVASGKNTLYLAGGEFPDGSASRSMWRYDPVLDVWQEMAPMLVPRSELGLALLDGNVYAVGGWEGSFRLDTVERYNPETNSWHFIPQMRIAVTSPAVVSHDGMLYVTGVLCGCTGGAVLEDGDGIELVQRYDPRTSTWTELAPMLIPRSGSAACVLNGYIYVIGGWHASTENTNKVERYNMQTNTWEFKAPMRERRYRPGVAVVDRHIYVLGGEEGWDRYHDTIECYNPDTDSWQLTGDMPTSRSWLSCVTLQVTCAVTTAHVTVVQGVLRGIQQTSRASGKPYYSFQGIPYAKPPVGPLRFKAPQEPLSWTGVRDALHEGASCPQVRKNHEDCLFLNVHTPQLPGSGSSTLKPVIVWIHGGGFIKGSGSTNGFGPDYFVDEGVLMVTFNYRLGVIGFLSLEGTDVASNAGLKDQVAALRWVKKNIAKFGGDPDNVTIYGQSAGSASVSYQVLSPMSKGLFRRAIAQSGSALNPWAFMSNPRERAFRLARVLGYKGNDSREVVQLFRNVTADRLIAEQSAALTAEEKSDGQIYGFVGAIEKSVSSGDEVFLPDSPHNLLKSGNFNKVSYLAGDCSAEYGITAATLNSTPASTWANLNKNYEVFVPADLGLKKGSEKSLEVAEKIKKFYFGSQGISLNTVEQYYNLRSDLMFVKGVYKYSMDVIRHSSAPVYNYLFSYNGRLGKSSVHGATPLYGPSHTDDLTYLFYYTAATTPFPANSSERITQQRMVSIWTNFAKTGNPSLGLKISWPANTATNTHCLNINATLSMENGFEKTRMSFWDSIYKLYGKDD
ncbi:uncharacterized protein LOC134545858 isoform X3 [Bacillus rossius redtenbacheri]|uniref:uncharacterized protein LOC134545858 isoform X3 n=1 Tax=Bacillus rossius redtenbacheri TaxID=93214 RepID=UPI002FDCDAD1